MPSKPNPSPTASERTKAAKLRLMLKSGQTLSPGDAAWLADYEAAREKTAEALGASQTRKVEYREEETQALGLGPAAAEAAAAAAMSREEGRRLDSLMALGMSALVKANETYGRMVEQIIRRNEQLERAHVDMMGAYRQQFLERVEAEGEAVALANDLDKAEGGENDKLGKLAEELLPLLLNGLEGAGVTIPKKGG